MTLHPAPAEMSDRLKPAYDLLDRAVADGAFPAASSPSAGTTNSPCIPSVISRATKISPPSPPTQFTTSPRYQAHRHHHRHHEPGAARRTRAWTRPSSASCPNGPRPQSPIPIPPGARASPFACSCCTIRACPRIVISFKGQRRPKPSSRACMAEPLVREPGTQIEYSDLGFILLGEIVQRLTGDPLDENAQGTFSRRLRMNNSLFNPPKNLRSRIAPTEDDTTYRKRLHPGRSS